MDLNTVSEFAPASTASWRRGDAWLGGGTWLFSQPQPAVTRLLDLRTFGWTPLRETEDGLTIAATCTLAELARWRPADPARDHAAALARQCCHALLGSFKIHHVATVGGNICLALPAGPMTSLTAALDGVATLRAPDGALREMSVTDLVTGDGRNALTPGELLTDVAIPAAALTARTAFRRLSLSPLGRSAVLVIARREHGSGFGAGAQTGTGTGTGAGTGTGTGATVVTVTAATPRPVQLRFSAPPAPAEALAGLDAAVPASRYLDDVHGSARWRRAMTRRYVAETLAELAA